MGIECGNGARRARQLLLTSASAAAIIAVSSSAASAQTWTGATSNDWTVGSNWSGGVAPTAGSVTNINTNSPNSAVVGASGAATATSGTLFIGDVTSGTLTIQNGSTLTSSANAFSLVGRSGGTGTVNVTGAGSQWNVTGIASQVSVILGQFSGTGVLNVSDGGSVTTAGDMVVGERNSGTGVLSVTSGGTVTTGRDAYIGRLADARGTATVTGAGSHWTINSRLFVGNGGAFGVLNISDGGTVTVATTTTVADSGTPGTLNISSGGTLETAALTGGTGANQFNFDNATIRALAGGVNFMSGYTPAEANIAAGGLTIDTNGFSIGVRAFSGVGGLTITGGGVVEYMTGISTYTGPTWIQAGSTLEMNFGTISSSSRVIADGTFDISGGAPNAGLIQSLAGSGTVVTQANRNLTLTNANDTFSGVINGSAQVRVTGGTQTLSGANVYTGNTLVSGTGTLRAGAVNTFSAASNFIAQTGGTYDLNGFDQTVASLDNAGTVNLGGAPGTTLTVTGDYIGNNGLINLNTRLGGDVSPTDRVVIGGNTSGDATLRVTNIGGSGAPTTNGIKVVDVGGASNGTFSLLGDYVFNGQQAVIGGAYAYTLQKNGIATPADGDWYLRSSLINPPSGAPAGPIYQPGVPLYEAYPQVMFALNNLPTLQQRVGNRYWDGDAAALAAGDQPEHERSVFWARTEGSYARSTASGSATLSDYNIGQWSARTGFDGLLYRNDDGMVVGGLTAHYGLAAADIHSLYGDGRINTSGRGIGGTLTWYGATGFYIDSQAQVTFFDSQFKSDLVGRDMARDGGGLGYAFSVETGKRFGMGGPWALTPQAQLIYSAVEADFTDSFGTRVSLDGNDRLTGRLGLALDHQHVWRDDDGKLARANLYGVANAYYEFIDGTNVNVAGTNFTSATERTSAGFGLGGTYNWDNDKYSVYGEALIKTAFDDDYSIGGTAGFRMRW